jgi:cell division protease FtsH
LVFLGKEIGEQRDYSEAVAQEIDAEVRRIVGEAHDQAKETLTHHLDQLNRIAQRLIEVETLDSEQFISLFEGTSEGGSSAPQSPPTTNGIERPISPPNFEQSAPTLDMPPAPAPA